MKKNAIITAVSLEVGCPECGEPQPSPETGSEIWLIDEVKASDGSERKCVSCDVTFRVIFHSRVSVGSDFAAKSWDSR